METNYGDQLLSINQVRQLKKSVAVEHNSAVRDDLLHDISTAIMAPDRDSHMELRWDLLKKANKDQLCLSVEMLVLAFSATALPLLEDTFKDAESVEEMK